MHGVRDEVRTHGHTLPIHADPPSRLWHSAGVRRRRWICSARSAAASLTGALMLTLILVPGTPSTAVATTRTLVTTASASCGSRGATGSLSGPATISVAYSATQEFTTNA